MKKILTTLTGPSCAGKSTLEKMLAEKGCLAAVSTTTRPPRVGEHDGIHYYFLDNDAFNAQAAEGGFIECVRFGEHQYGVSVAELERQWEQGDHVVLVVEPNGAKQIREWARTRPDVRLQQAFITNPPATIAERFLRRYHQDMPSRGSDTGSMSDIVTRNYTHRLAMIMTGEQQWVRDAAEDAKYRANGNTPAMWQYDVFYPQFTDNADDVVQELLSGKYLCQNLL